MQFRDRLLKETENMSSKKLMTGLTVLMLVALASMGVAYGYWTETLNINGNVGTGEPDVEFWGAWEDGNYPDGGVCTGSVDATGSLWTITLTNAYPGYSCDVGVWVHNSGTIPVKVQPPVLINNTSPWTPSVSAYPANTMLQVGPVSQASAKVGVTINVAVPASVSGDDYENGNYTFSYTVDAGQVNAP
jgi:hypothetical protein